MPVKISYTCADIAAFSGGVVEGNPNKVITALGRIETATADEISFFANPKYAKHLETTHAGCLFVERSFHSDALDQHTVLIRVDNPYVAFVMLLKRIDAGRSRKPAGVHPTAIIGEGCSIDSSAHIGSGCVVGSECTIGKNVVILPGAIIEDFCSIGEGTLIHSGVVLREDTQIGTNCIIHSGAVIGGDGFGFVEDAKGAYHKIPQLGNVVIGDDVEIGCNTTVDRAMIGSTIIENGVKIDNLVQVAHNVCIGESTGIASQAGVSGSSHIGKRNRFGGQVGVAGHLTTADDVTLMAQSGVAKSIPEPGVYFGSPVRERMKAFKIEAAISNLTETLREIGRMKKDIEELKKNG